MNSQDFRNLQEAYLNVYQELDENRMASRMEKMPTPPAKVGKATHSIKDLAPSKPPTPEEKAKARKALGLDERVLGQDPEMRRARTKDEKRLPPSSGKGYADNQKKSISYMNKLTKNNKIIPGMAHEEVEEFDEATAMAKRGKDETAIRNTIASQTRGGEFADKATALAGRETYGNNAMKAGRENLARTQRGDFRNTTSSSPGLRGYGHKSSDPAVKAKQDARGNQRARAALTPNERKQNNMESYDLFDYMMEYLISEGYADTNENALVIMANMSEDWKNNILEARVDDSLSDEEKQDARNKRSGGQSDFTRRNLTKAGRGKSPKGMKPVETTPAMTSMRKYEMALNQPNTRMGRIVRDNIAMDKAERGPSGRRGS